MNKLNWMIAKEWLLQKLFHKPIRVRDSWATTPAKFQDMVEFLNWFDVTDSVINTVQKAEVDWRFRFASFPYYKGMKKQTALEIGFGGGRLLAQASKDFERVYGVDIHESFDMSRRFLESQGCANYTLLNRDQISSIPDGGVNFVYSFIVFQHFDSMDEVDYYIDHIERLLDKDGLAHIYFGKSKGESIKVTPENRFKLRDCSLFISPPVMREYLERKFVVSAFEDSVPKNPHTGQGESVQALAVLKKKNG